MKAFLIAIFTLFLTFGQSLANESLRLGSIMVNTSDRSIQFPANVNLVKGGLEFILVHSTGKVHEALFYTVVDVKEINAALLLLGEESLVLDSELRSLSSYPQLKISVRGQQETSTDWLPVARYLSHSTVRKLSPLDWRYTGSFFYENRFMARIEGDIIALHARPSSLINLSHSDNDNDLVWHVNQTHLKWEKEAQVLLKLALR